ncbi:MAG TPA: MFS transporter [Solirubrobacterales bacterium]
MAIAEDKRKWWTLAGACAGLFLLMLDSTVVALALPVIHRDLGATPEALQWTMNGYLLTIAILVISAGRLGDMFGRKRAFLLGLVVFAAGSVLSGAASGPEMLIAGRVVQGVGAAPMLTLSLAIICNVFPGKAEQASALGIWAAVSAVALAIGPLAGGALIEIDWRVIFWVNVPIAALGIAIMAAAAPESTDPGAGRRIDWGGLALLSSGLFAVVLALVEADAWGAAAIVVGLAGVALLLAFGRLERRAPDPLVDLTLFRNRPYFGASAAAFALVGSYWAVMFFQPQYLQDARGHSAVESGLLILPITVPMIFISPFSGRLIARFGARRLMTTGMVLGTLGMLALTQIDGSTPYGLLLVGYLLFGIALGLVYAPMSTAAMAAMPAEKVGIAAGVLAMDRLVAGAVALAASGAVFHALLGDGRSFSSSVAGSTWVVVVLCAFGAGLTWAFVRDPDPLPRHDEPAREHLHRRFHL